MVLFPLLILKKIDWTMFRFKEIFVVEIIKIKLQAYMILQTFI